MATRAPTAKPCTPLPTASIVPAISWPSTIGSFTRTVPKPQLVVVQVRAANTAEANACLQLPRAEGRRVDLFDPEVAGGMNDECVHVSILHRAGADRERVAARVCSAEPRKKPP